MAAGAAVADGFVGETVGFHLRRAFWASEIAREDAPDGKRLSQVPALQIGGLLSKFRPDVVVLDVEGGEAGLFDAPWPLHVRLLIMEIRTRIYGPEVVQRIFDGLSRSAMVYMPCGSRAETLVFQRFGAAA